MKENHEWYCRGKTCESRAFGGYRSDIVGAGIVRKDARRVLVECGPALRHHWTGDIECLSDGVDCHSRVFRCLQKRLIVTAVSVVGVIFLRVSWHGCFFSCFGGPGGSSCCSALLTDIVQLIAALFLKHTNGWNRSRVGHARIMKFVATPSFLLVVARLLHNCKLW